jgi:hypothetical protein
MIQSVAIRASDSRSHKLNKSVQHGRWQLAFEKLYAVINKLYKLCCYLLHVTPLVMLWCGVLRLAFCMKATQHTDSSMKRPKK